MHIEKKILLLLQKHNHYEHAFLALPLQFQKLFIHAYQSYIFNKYLIIRYNEYSKNFNKPLSGENLIDDLAYAPLIGSRTELVGQSKEIYTRILLDEKVSLEDFKRKLAIKLGSRGSNRSVGMKPHKLAITEIAEDELNPEKTRARLSFELRKGSYATEVIKEFLNQGVFDS